MKTLDFILPEGFDATEPPPARDGVRLLVARPAGMRHARFSQLGQFLAPGDLVVVNTSATLAAAVDGKRGGTAVEVHFSAELGDGAWVVEVRPAGPPAHRGDGPPYPPATGPRRRPWCPPCCG